MYIYYVKQNIIDNVCKITVEKEKFSFKRYFQLKRDKTCSGIKIKFKGK